MKKTRHEITFAGGADQEAVVLAKLGIGNREIARRTDLSDCQITYRLHKSKTAEEAEHGYRVDWRNGNSSFFATIYSDIAGIIRKEIERKVVPRLVHPTPKVAPPPKERRAPTVDEVTRALRRAKFRRAA